MPGNYFLHVGPNNFLPGNPLANMLSSTSLVPLGDDTVGENGVDDPSPAVNGIRTAVFVLGAGSLPVNTGTVLENGFENTYDDALGDSDIDLTQDLGLSPISLSVGNWVFLDRNNNGRYDALPAGSTNVTGA